MKEVDKLKTIEKNGNKFKFLFPDKHFYYSCETCQINCCTRNDKILLHKDFKSKYSSMFKCKHQILNLGVCPELQEDGRCKIELELGKFAKPDICNIFPYHILGKYNDIYYISLDYSSCSLKESGTTPVSIKNFFEQTKNINLSFYNFNDRFIISNKKKYKLENKTLLEFFTQNYNLSKNLIESYWNSWNKYYEQNLSFPKYSFLIEGYENSILETQNTYTQLEAIEKISLIYLMESYKKITKKSIDSFTFMNILKELKKTIKILTLFNKKLIFNKKLDINSEYFMDLVTVYQLNKTNPLCDTLEKIKTKEKGSFMMELARFI